MRDKRSYVVALFIIGCILINCAGKSITKAMELPLWLDSVGTILAAYFCGPVCGAVVGVSVNIIYGFFYPLTYVYALTSIAIGSIVGICAKKKLLRTLFGTLTTGFLVSAASVSISTPLNCVFFGGYTNNKWGDGVDRLQ